MKNIYGLEPDICIIHPEIITDSAIDVVLPKYFYNQLHYLKDGNFQDSTKAAVNILCSLIRQEETNLLIFQNNSHGIVYFLDETSFFIDIDESDFDIRLPLDRYCLSLLSFSKKIESNVIFFATSYQVIKRCRFLGFSVVSKGISVLSGKSWLQPEILEQKPGFSKKPGFDHQQPLSDRYRILKPITQGKGKTFLAVDEGKPLKPCCVIQRFSIQTPESTELFRQKVRYLRELDKHPQLPALLDYFMQNNYHYLVQEFVDGVSLAEEMLSDAFTEAEIRSLLNDLLPVLQFLHTAGVIHRDIKPHNIIRRRGDRQLVLVDFGAFDLVTNNQTATEETLVGSPEYAAPEQVMGKSTFASDLYSLGITCIHLLTMIDPFDLLDRFQSTWTWRDYLVDNPVSHQLGYVLDKLVERCVEKRYQSATEVLTDLHPQPMSWLEQDTLSQIHWQDANSLVIRWRDINR